MPGCLSVGRKRSRIPVPHKQPSKRRPATPSALGNSASPGFRPLVRWHNSRASGSEVQGVERRDYRVRRLP